MSEDYYQILGVAKDATGDALKKVYRRAALKYHPDKNKGNKKAEDRFKKINEAYAVLSDKEKRKQYDMFGDERFHQRYSTEDIFSNFDMGSIFKEFDFFSSGSSHNMSGRVGGFGRHGSQEGFNFQNPFGKQQFGRGESPPARGEDLTCSLTVTLDEVIKGVKRTVSYNRGNSTEKVTITVPKGIKSGKKLRLAKKGGISRDGGLSGDLYLTIIESPHPLYTRVGDDLLIKKEISLTDAVLGISLEVETFNGKKRIKIAPGTQSQTKIRLANLGVPHFDTSERGDLFVLVHITIPKQLSSRQKEIFEELKNSGI